MNTWIDVQALDSTGKRTICEARPAGIPIETRHWPGRRVRMWLLRFCYPPMKCRLDRVAMALRAHRN
jgi:hypothetical protein